MTTNEHSQDEPTEQAVDPTLLTAVFGRQVEQFWDSQIGQYLLERSLREYNSAILGLKTCNPTDVAAITKFQSDLIRAEGFRDWLSEAIQDGLRAKNVLEGLDE